MFKLSTFTLWADYLEGLRRTENRLPTLYPCVTALPLLTAALTAGAVRVGSPFTGRVIRNVRALSGNSQLTTFRLTFKNLIIAQL